MVTAFSFPPEEDSGVLIGWEDEFSNPWRLAVEMYAPTRNTRWGRDAVSYPNGNPGDTWDNAKWVTKGFRDITADVRGISWRRGADEWAGRPAVGVCTLTLDNRSSVWDPLELTPLDELATTPGPIKSDAFRPGTFIRIGVHATGGTTPPFDWTGGIASGWVPLFAGVVESWPTPTSGRGADRFAEVTLVETVSLLAKVDENALASVVGNDDTPRERITRLLEAAHWAFGGLADASLTAGYDDTIDKLQSTDMSLNRLAECYLTADSAGLVFHTHPSGLPFLRPHVDLDPNDARGAAAVDVYTNPYADDAPAGWDVFQAHPAEPNTDAVMYAADSLRTRNDDDGYITGYYLANVGVTSSASEAPSEADRARWGYRVYQRTDLICKNVTTAEWALSQRLPRTHRGLVRADSIDLHSGLPGTFPAIFIHELGDLVRVYPGADEVPYFDAHIDWMEHQITPRQPGQGVIWTARYGFGLSDLTRSTPL